VRLYAIPSGDMLLDIKVCRSCSVVTGSCSHVNKCDRSYAVTFSSSGRYLGIGSDDNKA
jgi:hypothetical protein